MARNLHTHESEHIKAVRGSTLRGERRHSREDKNDESDAATAGTAAASGLTTFIPELVVCRKLLDSALHQIRLLARRNAGLKAELVKLKQKEAQSRHLAYHDGLTGLPNRSLLHDRFRQAMSRAQRHHKPLALLLLDLDNFKQVNDQLGHTSGDKLLQAVARRLTNGVRQGDTVCRYGGDEFVIMLPEIASPDIANALAAKVGGRPSEPYLVDGQAVTMAVSVGVAVYPGDGRTFEELIKQADIAMYRSKNMDQDISIAAPAKDGLALAEPGPPTDINDDEGVRDCDLPVQNEPVPLQSDGPKIEYS